MGLAHRGSVWLPTASSCLARGVRQCCYLADVPFICRGSLCMTVMDCPDHLRWAGASLEAAVPDSTVRGGRRNREGIIPLQREHKGFSRRLSQSWIPAQLGQRASMHWGWDVTGLGSECFIQVNICWPTAPATAGSQEKSSIPISESVITRSAVCSSLGASQPHGSVPLPIPHGVAMLSQPYHTGTSPYSHHSPPPHPALTHTAPHTGATMVLTFMPRGRHQPGEEHQEDGCCLLRHARARQPHCAGCWSPCGMEPGWEQCSAPSVAALRLVLLLGCAASAE